MQRSAASILTLFMLVAVLSSCSLFRKKNKCVSCPTWHDEIQTELPVTIEKEH